MARPIRTIAQWEMDKQREEPDRPRRLRNAHIPEHMRGLSWDDYQLGSGTSGASKEELRDILMDYADHWTPAQRDGLVLLGAAGFGKTLGAVLTAMQINDAGGWVKYSTEEQWDSRRKKLIGLEQHAQATDDWQEANAAAYRLKFIERECDVLVLDDVGKAFRHSSGYTNNGVDTLLRQRNELGKVTILTSNLPHQQWATIDPSLASFLYEVGEVVPLTRGKDFRVVMTDGQRRRRASR